MWNDSTGLMNVHVIAKHMNERKKAKEVLKNLSTNVPAVAITGL
jgi:hypothetical protein